jgi:hypothetical protein
MSDPRIPASGATRDYHRGMLRRVALSGLALLLALGGLALWLQRDRGARGGPASDIVPSAEAGPAPTPALAGDGLEVVTERALDGVVHARPGHGDRA